MRTSSPERRRLEARERLGLYFVLRLESGLRLLGAAYRSEASRSTKRVSRWDVWDPVDGFLEQFQLPGSRQGLSAAVGVELAVEVVDVGLDRAHADEKLGGDPAVTLAGGYEPEDFQFPFT